MYDFEQARKYDSEGAEVARRFKVLEAEANSLINLGIDVAHTGQSPLPLFQQVDSIFERDAWYRWRYNLRHQAAQSDYWLKAGDFVQAREFADRLLDEASLRSVRKYMATAHALRGGIHAAQNRFAEAESEFTAALKILREFPAVLTAWRTWAALGSSRAAAGDQSSAGQAFMESAALVRQIASYVTDESLRNTFLSSPAVTEVFRGEG